MTVTGVASGVAEEEVSEVEDRSGEEMDGLTPEELDCVRVRPVSDAEGYSVGIEAKSACAEAGV